MHILGNFVPRRRMPAAEYNLLAYIGKMMWRSEGLEKPENVKKPPRGMGPARHRNYLVGLFPYSPIHFLGKSDVRSREWRQFFDISVE